MALVDKFPRPYTSEFFTADFKKSNMLFYFSYPEDSFEAN
jgi:hypothetical protein